jgi:hypothetical protein
MKENDRNPQAKRIDQHYLDYIVYIYVTICFNQIYVATILEALRPVGRRICARRPV